MKRLIGITGGIGAGKSVVSRILRLNGFGVYDCDSEAKRIMDTSPQIISSLVERFGESVLNANGSLCRPEIARHIFSNDADRLWLNAIVHKAVREDLSRWAEKSEKNIFVESAILAESGLNLFCAQIWIVDAPDSLRVERAVARQLSRNNKIRENNIGENKKILPSPQETAAMEDDIRRRIQSQRNEFEALKRGEAEIIHIDNSGTSPLLPQIRSLGSVP